MQWTEAQAHTIESRGKNILVSAAAGSGKTAVLIERIKQLILQDKVDVDRFLITTFTNAASQEMRERLEQAIRKEMDQPDADRAFLKRQLDLMYKANIGTFHNFALEVMHRYFYLTELEPGFVIGDEIQVSILKKESVDALFETRFEEDFDRFKAFLRKYSGDRNENRLKDNMISLYDELRSVPDYFKWARESAEWLRSDNVLSMTGIAMFLIQAFYDGLGKARRYFVEAADLLADNSVWSLAEKAREDVDRLDSLEEIMSLEPEPGVSRWDELDLLFRAGELMGDLKFNTMRAAKDEKDDYEAVKETVSVLRKKGKKEIDDLKIANYEKQLARQKLEALYLKQQITPHFMINCLNTIYQLTENNHADLARQMLQNLSVHLRYTLSSGQTVSLLEELNLVKNYVELSSIRYPGALRLLPSCEESLQNATVVPLILLNFVENTIKYEVVMGKVLDMHIDITAQEENQCTRLHICIWDTGCGFSEDILAVLQKLDTYVNSEQEHIGITNVVLRLRQIFPDAAFAFGNRPGAGAQITIDFPYVPCFRIDG